MNKPIDPYELLVWLVRLFIIVLLLAILFGCAMNYATTAANPSCVVACSATAPSSGASGVRIDQTITREGVPDVGNP